MFSSQQNVSHSESLQIKQKFMLLEQIDNYKALFEKQAKELDVYIRCIHERQCLCHLKNNHLKDLENNFNQLALRLNATFHNRAELKNNLKLHCKRQRYARNFKITSDEIEKLKQQIEETMQLKIQLENKQIEIKKYLEILKEDLAALRQNETHIWPEKITMGFSEYKLFLNNDDTAYVLAKGENRRNFWRFLTDHKLQHLFTKEGENLQMSVGEFEDYNDRTGGLGFIAAYRNKDDFEAYIHPRSTKMNISSINPRKIQLGSNPKCVFKLNDDGTYYIANHITDDQAYSINNQLTRARSQKNLPFENILVERCENHIWWKFPADHYAKNKENYPELMQVIEAADGTAAPTTNTSTTTTSSSAVIHEAIAALSTSPMARSNFLFTQLSNNNNFEQVTFQAPSPINTHTFFANALSQTDPKTTPTVLENYKFT